MILKNNSNKILLSFCIPTYNRPNEFKNLLLCVVPQLSEYKDEIEVVVKDDSANNDSERTAKTILEDSGISFRYYRGKKEGIDPANLFIAEKASGKFVWWCGDDDEIMPGAVGRVMGVIKNTPDLAFIFVNFLTDGNSKPAVYEKHDMFFKDCNEFFNLVSVNMTLLSTGIFRREIGLKALPLAQKYIGTSFASQPLILEAITSGGKLYLLYGPYILNHPKPIKKGELRFYDGVYTFGVTYHRLLSDFRDKFHTKTIRDYHKRNFGHIWRGLIIDWVRRDMPAPRKRLWELRMYWTLPEYWFAFLIYLFPKHFVALGVRIYKKFVKRSYRQPR